MRTWILVAGAVALCGCAEDDVVTDLAMADLSAASNGDLPAPFELSIPDLTGHDAPARDLSILVDLMEPADLAVPDLRLAAQGLCTTPACANAPCTPNCFFAAPQNGCPPMQVMIPAAVPAACPGFCGFLMVPGYGCLRFRSEVQMCNNLCLLPWSNPNCLDWQPPGDYQNGGGICDTQKGYFCDSGPAPDMAPVCDMVMVD